MTDDEERQERELSELERVREFLRPRLDRAERLYGQVFTSLWLGNAGAALATLTFIGSALQKGAFRHFLLVPLGLFVLGLIAMGLGAAVSLMKEGRSVKRMERATSIRQFILDDMKSSVEQVGLVLDWRTWGAIVSAAAFILGVLAGLVELSYLN